MTWWNSIAITDAIGNSKFEITDIESDDIESDESLSIKEITILLQKLNSEFQKTSYLNKYLSKEFTQIQYFLIEPRLSKSK